jgi:hypothetical protein
MRVNGNPQASGVAQQGGRTGHGKPFADVLKGKKEEAPAVLTAFAAPPPPRDPAPVSEGQEVAKPEAIVSSLVEEIAAVAPPDASSAVDIQFNSRTLEGLHVRVQKTSEGVEVRFTASSEKVSRLLATNAESLATALIQRGYVAPTISVQSTPQIPTPVAPATSRSDHGGGGRGRQDQRGQGGSQKRR